MLPPVLVVALVAIIVAWLMLNRELVMTAANRAEAFWARLRGRPSQPAVVATVMADFFGAWDLLLRGGWLRALAADAASILLDVLTLFCVFWAAGYTPSPGVLLAGYGLPNLAGKLSILPGGVGVIEGGMAALFAALGAPGEIVVVAVLGYRLLSFWIPVALGFVFSIWLENRLGAAPDDGS
jgi:uncharacterized membrane protein YbhN (UPF0104 family)